jgi:hypothetical protein
MPSGEWWNPIRAEKRFYLNEFGIKWRRKKNWAFQVHRHFLESGGYYPVGGASEIAFNLIPVIESAGGKVLVRANVTRCQCYKTFLGVTFKFLQYLQFVPGKPFTLA